MPDTPNYVVPQVQMNDEGIENALHSLISGITELSPKMVRPRHQETAPNIPKRGVDWCAFGVMHRVSQNLPELDHSEEETSDIISYDSLEILVSFYGELADVKARQLRAGLYTPGNTKNLREEGLTFTRAGDVVCVSETYHDSWQRRYDVTFYCVHKLVSTVAIPGLEGIQYGHIKVDKENVQNATKPFGCGSL